MLGRGENLQKLAVCSKLLFSHCDVFKINTSAYICFCSCNNLITESLLSFPIKHYKRQQIKHITYKSSPVKFDKIGNCYLHLSVNIYNPLISAAVLTAEYSLELKIVSTCYMRHALNRCCFHFTEMKFVVILKKVDLSYIRSG